jgi:predicted DNA repair protein MutK
LNNIANYAYTLLLVVGVIALTWAGFMFVTANGEPEKMNKAKMMVVYALIGILLATLSRGIVGLIRGVVVVK